METLRRVKHTPRWEYRENMRMADIYTKFMDSHVTYRGKFIESFGHIERSIIIQAIQLTRYLKFNEGFSIKD